MSVIDDNPFTHVRLCCWSVHIVRLAKIVYFASLLTYLTWFTLAVIEHIMVEPKAVYSEEIGVLVTIAGITCYVLLYLTTFQNYNKALIVIYLLYETEQIGTYVLYWTVQVASEMQFHSAFFLIYTVLITICIILKPFYLYVYFKYYRFLSHEEQYGLQISTSLRMSAVSEERTHDMFPQSHAEQTISSSNVIN
ncbi:hypothetical protein QR680_007999 [Steinernema hermaphroditum]|uniref:Uncharacterized protein n=1 Tax=Steinernema hermaphroditum TaxID=289476 RepID=A0AA39IGD8_9BILA|nr:hypothetical protein QR680_007999 [Steinernema hermaphroditum]